MNIRRLIALAPAFLASLGVGAAQTTERCRIVSVEASSIAMEAGTPVTFRAKLSTVVPTAKPEFKWEISAGTITAGEGTSSITVDTTGLGGISIDATVSVSGVSTLCSTSATESVAIFAEVGCGLAFDQFSDIKFEDEKARLDNFAIQLSMDKQQRGNIIIFAGRQTYKDEASERLQRAKDYLVKVRDIDPTQVVTVDGGYREEFQVYFYIVPPGADPPSLEADVSPTDIELTKRRPKALAKKHR